MPPCIASYHYRKVARQPGESPGASCTNYSKAQTQIHHPYFRLIVVSCCYRPSSSTVKYLNRLCENLHLVIDKSKDIFRLVDLNIDWFSKNCPLCKELISMADACNSTYKNFYNY